MKTVTTKTKTNEKELAILKAKRDEAVAAYSKYAKEYNKEHNILGRTIIKEIIALHKKGVSNPDIIKKGYNKNTVMNNVRLFIKGKRVGKTIVAKYLPVKVK